jgi:hypothetical protein
MVYIPGGTFTLGCERNCAAGSAPAISGVSVSNYFIGKTEVTEGLYKAVMNKNCSQYGGTTSSCANIDWYQAMEFACELGKKTGKNYHMMTEAEFEYAAKTQRSSLSKIGDGSSINGEEWAYNSWDADKHTGGVDPIGPKSTIDGKITWGHTQKTRRDANGTNDNVTSRLIRSIDGIGPSMRLALSKDMAYPPDMIPPCDIHAPALKGGEPKNSYRDPRWVTGSDKKWTTGSIAIVSFDLFVWEDGTARLTAGFGGSAVNGQWFTSNNFSFVFVPSSGSATKFAYIFLTEEEGSLISDKNIGTSGSYVGRIVKASGSATKPSVTVQSGEALARAQSNFETDYKMVDMVNIPSSAQKQDSRLLDGTSNGWFQDNTSQKGTHHYRKDIDADEFRFTVNDLPYNSGSGTILTNGAWFTVNNTFLRVRHKDGYTTDYLYTVTPGGTFYHNSFQNYERGDFRMFEKKANSSSFPCAPKCSGEIPKNQAASFYATQEKGKSTFVPAPN